MTMTAQNLEGCYVALITPMRRVEGQVLPQIDFDRFYQLIRNTIDAGVSGLLVAGTTGQSATVTHDEHVDIAVKGASYAHWYAHEQGRTVQIMAGAGSNATHEAISLSERIVTAAPIDALLHVTGYYNNPPQEGLIAHFEAIATRMQEHRVPIILYNVPGRTNSDLAAETVIHLARHPNIIGIKEASGKLDKIQQILAATDSCKFRVVSGEDHLVYDIMRRGGTGVISATANRWPREYQRLVELCRENNWEAAEELQKALLPCSQAVFCVKNPIPLAYMFNSEVRLPLVGVDRLNEALRTRAVETIEKALSITEFPRVSLASYPDGGKG